MIKRLRVWTWRGNCDLSDLEARAAHASAVLSMRGAVKRKNAEEVRWWAVIVDELDDVRTIARAHAAEALRGWQP